MGEKSRNAIKQKKSENQGKIPRLVALPFTCLRNGDRLFSGVRKHRKQAGPTLYGRGILAKWGKIQGWARYGQLMTDGMNYMHEKFQDLQQKRAGMGVEVQKIMGMAVTMTHNILLTRLQEARKFFLLTRGGVPKDPYRRRHGQAEEWRMTSTLPPFLRPGLLHSPYLLSNVMRSKRFLSHLILTLSWYLKNKTRSRWEKFASSYNPFFRVVQITIRATARITRNTTRFSP